MIGFIDVTEKNKDDYNKVVTHPLQSYEWGEFRKKTGVKVVRRALVDNDKIVDGFTLTVHKIPSLPYYVGYLPKGLLPTPETLTELERIGKEEKCIYIQLEPNLKIENLEFKKLIENCKLKIENSFHPLFTKYTFILDLTKSEEELLAAMHPKTRYNIKVAQKHNVEIIEDNSNEAFEMYLKLTHETTNRQKFYAHTAEYHKKMWETIKVENGKMKDEKSAKNKLESHLLLANYKTQLSSFISHLSSQTLTTWILFTFHDTLYYPYGASSNEHRNVMASNLMMWEAIKFGKKLRLEKFDMWGALGPNPDKNDPWYGFHRFKEGYGGTLTEFVGSYDLIINPFMYKIIKFADKARWLYLRLKK